MANNSELGSPTNALSQPPHPREAAASSSESTSKQHDASFLTSTPASSAVASSSFRSQATTTSTNSAQAREDDGDGANEDLLALADDDGCSEESDSENGDDVRFDDMKRINIAEGDDVPIDDDGSNDGVDSESCAEESDDDIESDRSGMEIWEGPQPSYMIRRKGSPQYDNSLDTGPIRKSSVEIQATGSSTTEVKVHRAKKAKTGEQALQQDTEAGEDAGDDLPSATKHDPDRPVILQLAKVKVHANNRGAFSDQELLAIYNETSSNPILHYDLSRLSFVKDRKKSTLDPVYNITGADGQYQTQTLGNFHLGPDGVMMRGHAHQTKWHFSEGTKLLWEYGCFNLRSESHPTVEEICRRAIRDSHPEYLRGGGSEKDFMKKTSNMVGKRFKACLRRWFVVGDDADLPEMIQTLYKNKTAGSARWEGMLRDYLRQSTLDKVDRNEQLRLNGHASVEANDGAPDSYEIAFEPRTEPTRPLKRKRTVQASSTAEAPRSTAKSSSSTTRAPKASEASSTAATTSSPRRPRAPSPHYRPDAQAAPTRATCGPDLDRHELLWNLSFSGRSRK